MDMETMTTAERLETLRNIQQRRQEVTAQLQKLIQELHHMNEVEAEHRTRLYGTVDHAQN